MSKDTEASEKQEQKEDYKSKKHMRRLHRRTGEGEGGRKMWDGNYRVIDLRIGCAERSSEGRSSHPVLR